MSPLGHALDVVLDRLAVNVSDQQFILPEVPAFTALVLLKVKGVMLAVDDTRRQRLRSLIG